MISCSTSTSLSQRRFSFRFNWPIPSGPFTKKFYLHLPTESPCIALLVNFKKVDYPYLTHFYTDFRRRAKFTNYQLVGIWSKCAWELNPGHAESISPAEIKREIFRWWQCFNCWYRNFHPLSIIIWFWSPGVARKEPTTVSKMAQQNAQAFWVLIISKIR